MYRWLTRWPFVALIAAAMGWLGLWLMFLDGPWFPSFDEFYTQWVVGASVALWSLLSSLLARSERLTWAWAGLISPFLGSLLVAPPASLAFVMMKGYIACPVGLGTGLLISLLFQQRRSDPHAPPSRRLSWWLSSG